VSGCSYSVQRRLAQRHFEGTVVRGEHRFPAALFLFWVNLGLIAQIL
jgi:hypothetical protein